MNDIDSQKVTGGELTDKYRPSQPCRLSRLSWIPRPNPLTNSA